MNQNDLTPEQANGNYVVPVAELVAIKSEIYKIREGLDQIMHLLQTPQQDIPRPNNLEKYIGMWSDFDEEDEAIFASILAERGYYFTGRAQEPEE